jgi:acetolactate synthase-1/2/3 large subunit
MDYANLLVRKPWGWEYECFRNEHCAIWILHIARGLATSLHCHPNKRTKLIVLQGEVAVRKSAETVERSKLYTALQSVDFGKGVYHQTSCPGSAASENGAFLMEIEWPPLKDDLVRADDEYGRAGTAYEGGDNLIPAPRDLLKLKLGVQRAMGCRFTIENTGPFRGLDIGDGLSFTIEKDTTIKVSDYIANFIADLGITHVFGVVGGGSMHLNDSFGHHHALKFIPTHHEQAAAMAAEAYARLHGIGCCLVTTGPGGTNAMTGLACAWVDSIPVIFISGQVTRNTLIGDTGVRQLGVQETDIVSLVRPMTKYATTITDEKFVRFELKKAHAIATEGRPGPVWLDIPLDIQGKSIDLAEQSALKFHKFALSNQAVAQGVVMHTSQAAEVVWEALRSAKRPVIIAGNGIHLAGAEHAFRNLVGLLSIPVVTSWTGADLLESDHPCHIGHCGIFGDRASNFAVQNADFLLVLGSRLSIPQIGHNFQYFAREARIVMVDIDGHEILKQSLKVDIPIVADVKEFMTAFFAVAKNPTASDWLSRCKAWKAHYPVLAENKPVEGCVNSYHFVDELCRQLPDDAVVVTDMGTAFTCTFQAAKMKRGQRWITASGHAPMGYGLPGAIGAHYATGKPVVAIVGDGGLMFNLHCLATIAHNKLPITIFVLDNQGYLAMKHTFSNHFGRQTGSDEGSGLWCPNAWAMANVMGIEWSGLIQESTELIRAALGMPTPSLWQIVMPPDQPLLPRSTSLKRPDGGIVSKPIEDLFPFLPRAEFKAQMIVPTVEVLK